LLTLKGQRCLASADVVLYDGLVNPALLKHSQASAVRTCRVGLGSQRHLEQQEINQRLIDEARQGRTVVRLKGGDPFIFGRGSEEAAALAEAGIPFEVVPGITAATAAAVYAGISLTHRELASAVAFVTGHEDPGKPTRFLDFEILAKFPGTLVFYMGLHRLSKIAETLQQHGKPGSTPVAVISRGSTPRQRTVTGHLKDIAESVQAARLHAPSLIIVGECARQHESINWFEKLPLFGVSIGITRPAGHEDTAADLAWSLGADPVLMPTIQIEPVTDWSEVDRTLQRIADYQWIIFTSVNGVDALLNRLWGQGKDARALAGIRLAAIGPATAERLQSHRLHADLVPEEYRGEALAEALAPYVRGQKVLWARASRGREVIPAQLRAAGAELDSVVVYRHVDVDRFEPEVEQRLAAGELHWIALSSPSIARNIARLVPAGQRAQVRFAAISPVTAAAAHEAGLQIDVIAEEYTWAGLVSAIRRAHHQA